MADDQFSYEYEPLCDYYQVTLRRGPYAVHAFVSSSHLIDEKRPQLEAAIEQMEQQDLRLKEAFADCLAGPSSPSTSTSTSSVASDTAAA